MPATLLSYRESVLQRLDYFGDSQEETDKDALLRSLLIRLCVPVAFLAILAVILCLVVVQAFDLFAEDCAKLD